MREWTILVAAGYVLFLPLPVATALLDLDGDTATRTVEYRLARNVSAYTVLTMGAYLYVVWAYAVAWVALRWL